MRKRNCENIVLYAIKTVEAYKSVTIEVIENVNFLCHLKFSMTYAKWLDLRFKIVLVVEVHNKIIIILISLLLLDRIVTLASNSGLLLHTE